MRVMVLFDNEEIGSGSLMGAESTCWATCCAGWQRRPEQELISRRKSMILSCVGRVGEG